MAAPTTYTIQGQTVQMPVEVRDASTGLATYLVSASAAQALLPDDAFEVAEVLPGRTPLALAAIDYRDNDLGDYHRRGTAGRVFSRRAAACWQPHYRQP